MKKVYIVQGNPNTGKTTFIKSVMTWLLAYEFDFENLIGKSNGLLNGTSVKTLDVFGICTKDDLKVAILSAGDSQNIINLNSISEVKNCDVLVCASNNANDTNSIKIFYPQAQYSIVTNYSSSGNINTVELEKVRKSIASDLSLSTNNYIISVKAL